MGYLTLRDLGSSLIRQGVPVRVSEDCADDVYAIRAPKTDWPSLRAALVADGRLTISDDGGTWAFRLDPANVADERKALEEYEESVRSQLHGIIEPARQKAESLFAFTGKPMVAEITKLDAILADLARRKEWTTWLSFHLASDARTNDDYARVAIPAFLTSPRKRLGVIQYFGRESAKSLVVPKGDLMRNDYFGESFGGVPEYRKTDEVDLPVRFATKLVWDPLTLTTGFRWGYWSTEIAKDPRHSYRGPSTWRLTPMSSQGDRRIPLELPKTGWRFAPAVRDIAWNVETQMPEHPLSVTDAALRWARGTDKNFLAYVSPLGDLTLRSKSTRSLFDVVEELDSGILDRQSVAAMVEAWVGEEGGYPWSRVVTLPSARRATLLSSKGFTILRTETRFLDGLVDKNLIFPAAWSNLRLAEKSLHFDDIVRWVSEREPKSWRSGLSTPSELRRWNSVAFYPFAVLFDLNPRLKAEVLSLTRGDQLERSFDGLQVSGRLKVALESAAPYNDSASYGADPMLFPLMIHDSATNLVLEAWRIEDRIDLKIKLVGDDPTHMENVWRSSVRLPQ